MARCGREHLTGCGADAQIIGEEIGREGCIGQFDRVVAKDLVSARCQRDLREIASNGQAVGFKQGIPCSGKREVGIGILPGHIRVGHDHEVASLILKPDLLHQSRYVVFNWIIAKCILSGPEVDHVRPDAESGFPVRFFQIVPAYGFVVDVAASGYAAVAYTEIDAVVVAQFTELPEHLGPGRGQEQDRTHGVPVGVGGSIPCGVSIVSVSIDLGLVAQPFLVVAFHVGHQILAPPAPVRGKGSAQITAVAHHRLGVGVIHIAPKHEPTVRQRTFFCIACKVFEDHKGTGSHRPNVLTVIVQTVDASLIIGVPARYAVQIVRLGKALRKIHAEAIHPVFFEPVLEDPFGEILGVSAFVVHVVTDIEGMFRVFIEPGIVRRGPIVHIVPVKLGEWTLAELMIQSDVQYDGDVPAVTFFNELF